MLVPRVPYFFAALAGPTPDSACDRQTVVLLSLAALPVRGGGQPAARTTTTSPVVDEPDAEAQVQPETGPGPGSDTGIDESEDQDDPDDVEDTEDSVDRGTARVGPHGRASL